MAKSLPTSTVSNENRYHFPPALLVYANKITFPWPLHGTLDGSAVGDVFFRHDATPEWSIPDVREALLKLSENHCKDSNVSTWHEVPADLFLQSNYLQVDALLSSWEQVVGLVLLLDQAPRNLLRKGTNTRYIYHHFDLKARQILDILLNDHRSTFRLETWRSAGIAVEQAALRILMLLAPLVHSENLSDQTLQLGMSETIRAEYEKYSGTSDPYRKTYDQDIENIYLMNSLLRDGPPQGKDVPFSDFLYWILRYYTSHVAYVKYFGRSPFRNVAVGRPDAAVECDWLQHYGIVWDESDETTRALIRRDVEGGTWTPLQL